MITYYVENEARDIVLFDSNLTKLQNALMCMPQYAHLEIKQTERPIVNFEFADTPEYLQRRMQERADQFHRDFFQTSLGWIRRKVSMKTGEIKDFLTDLLPTIAVAQMLGRPANVITYNEPDFTQETVNWEALQEIKMVTPAFITECANQTDTDFTGIYHELVGAVPQIPSPENNTFSGEESIDSNESTGE